MNLGSPSTPAETVFTSLREDQDEQIQRVRVSSITAGGQARVIRDGQATVDAISYPIIDGVTLLAGDEALMLRVGSSYVVCGRIRSARTAHPLGRYYHLYAEQELVTVSSSVAETDIYSCSIPGGWLADNRHFKLQMDYDVLANAGGAQTFTLRVYLGTTKMFEDDTPNVGNQATVMPGKMEILLFATGVNAQQISGNINLASKTAHSAVGLGDIGTLASISSPFSGVASEVVTADKTFRVSIQFNASSASLRFRAWHTNVYTV